MKVPTPRPSRPPLPFSVSFRLRNLFQNLASTVGMAHSSLREALLSKVGKSRGLPQEAACFPSGIQGDMKQVWDFPLSLKFFKQGIFWHVCPLVSFHASYGHHHKINDSRLRPW